jgi:hypothetical protein
MMYQMTWKTLVMLLLFAAIATAQQKSEIKTFTGTWTCLNCSLAGLVNRPTAECEDLGHRHCLRLDNGKFLFFLDNDRAKALIQGGGRPEMKMSVTGIYYPNANTIDVHTYVIDGKTTSWCAEHTQMDLCNDHSTQDRAEQEKGK